MDTITELFARARDPMELTEQDIEKIIEYNRAQRMAFQATGRGQKPAVPEVDLKKLGLL